MAIHVLRFEFQQRISWGVLAGNRIVPLAGCFRTTGDFVRNLDMDELKAQRDAAAEQIALGDVKVLSPVTADQQFLCQGANYRQHMIESGLDPDQKTFNMVFTKATGCIVSANSPVVRPRHVKFLDYEVELGIVLRRDLLHPTRVLENDLHEYVAGLVIVNDYSARDVQIPQMQFYKGKSYRTFGPVGPYLCLLERDEMHYLKELDLELRVNGQVRQRDNTGNMVWGQAETLTELSGLHDLYAGDLLATGTPAGCALSIPSPARQRLGAILPERTKWRLFERIQNASPRYLKPGDVVEASISSRDGVIDLGVQRNVVMEESA